MIRILFGSGFAKSVRILPEEQQTKLSKALSTLERNPYDSKLHTKRLSGSLTGMLSFRLSMDWRVLFTFEDQWTIRLLRAAHRKNVYR